MIPLAGVSGFSLGHGPVHALGWTLLHFCWQGALVAGLLWCVLALTGDRAARARYAAASVALLLMAVLPVATFARLAAMETRGAAPVLIPALVLDVTADGSGGAKEPLRQRIAEGLDAAAAWIPAVWGVGLLLFLGRLNYGLIVAGRLKSKGTDAVPGALLQTFELLKQRLGVKRAVRLVQSAMVQVPTVIGWLRPVVLVPMGCFLGLSAEQVEALLAHELAHVRRHDYLVSVLQSVVEALLFYHPAVWWVSRQVRRERECCCDELAVGVGGDALAYARALTSLEEYRAAMPAMVLSANGGVLTMRIKRLLGRKEDSAVSQVAAFLILSAVMVVAGSYVVTAARAQSRRLSIAAPVQEAPLIAAAAQGDLAFVAPPAPFGPASTAVLGQADTQSPPLKPQYRTWLEQDVRWIITAREAQAFLGLANDEERDAFIANFWARRDPPGAPAGAFKEEHYARIAYANQHFATDKQAGWGTDRGHTYIAYGKPDETDAHPSATPYPYEVWHYHSMPGIGDGNVSVTFIDGPGGSSEYRISIDGANTPGSGKSENGGGRLIAIPVRLQDQQREVAAGVVPLQLRAADVQAVGALEGMVVDPTGAVVPRAAVTATDTATGAPVTFTTNNTGKFSFTALPPAVYTVEVSAAGFQRASQHNVHVDAGKTVGLNLRLKVGPVSQNLTVAAAPISPPPPQDQTFTPSPPPSGRPVRVSSGTAAGMAISQPAPVYPADAKAEHVQGVVVLHAVISKEGTVENLSVVSGPPELMVSAIDAVRQWKYKPYLLNGEPTAVETTININYTLADGSGTPAAGQNDGQSASAPLKAAASVMEGNLISKVQPVYPPEAKAAGVQGTVVLRAIISKEGTVEQLQVISGPRELGGSALDAVKQWKYKPYLLNGQPTEVVTTIEVHFSLEGLAAVQERGRAVRMKDGATAPVVISQVEPEYTKAARKAKASGIVVVNLTVNREGMPTQVHIVKGLGNSLDQKAIEAVKQYRFKPAMKDGQPVEEALNVEVNFQIF